MVHAAYQWLSAIYEQHNWVLYIVKGISITLQYSITSVVIGFFIGILLAFIILSENKIPALLARFYVSIIRGTPLLLQLSIVYFAIPAITGYKISAFASGVIAFSINSSAYICDIIRSGILAVDKGQFESAKVLNIPYFHMMKDIIFPQALRNILPALVNEIAGMIKESSIIAIIGEADLMRRAQVVAAEQYTYFAPLIISGICYYILVMTLSYFAKILEKRLNAKYI